ncbi:MAG: DUF3365 domain-containing protein [Candidatus Scalinduaceae bacterium]
MHPKLLKSMISMLVVMISTCSINNLNFAGQNDVDVLTQAHPSGENVNLKDEHIKCLQKLAETAIDVLIATRSVIAKNQELINRDPATGNYIIKGFVPAVVGSQVANDFSLMTGHRLKQTSLKVRNPSNAPDEWEKNVLKLLKSSEYSKHVGFGEILETNGKKIYRYMKPIYVDIGCLQCHGKKEEIRPSIRQFLEKNYPYDQAFGYKEGDFRSGISITVSLERLGF